MILIQDIYKVKKESYVHKYQKNYTILYIYILKKKISSHVWSWLFVIANSTGPVIVI